ncbi:hypothetical protein DNI29_02190 [Hymenobacter sediminis]|uniref:hypothetical protein n=1 Tax=Hymenobacter sediminis TaxID=2218621 RepID=UPI000DA64E4B|nr:hypothetical protein [Hymenobacter sediminis]RPD49631.1 hypothetical protein DNI29_02190 [Hymenobacter sediminis]
MSEMSKKWKARLLSSSLPLEHEVSKILSKYNFFTSYDYSYSRKENATNKDFSVDILGSAYAPFNNSNKLIASLNVLAECKFREEGKIWAFLPALPDANDVEFTLGATIKSLNHFSTRKVDAEDIYDFESLFPFSLKGTEISISSGEVFDKDIRHGILQLKYALPYLIKDSIESNCYGHLEDTEPDFIVPVLITNADLYIFNQEFSIDNVKEANNIDDIAIKTPYLILKNTSSPDFIQHHKTVFKNFSKIRSSTNINEFEAKQRLFKDKKYNIYESPLKEVEDLERSPTYISNKYYSQFFICHLNSFDEFINTLQITINKSLKRKLNKKTQ